MINSRNKGAQFEREVAMALYEWTGLRFKRNLEQYRARGLGDLVTDDPAWPFLIECKRAEPGNMRMEQWRRQAQEAADNAGLMPCVIYRLDRQPMRATIPLSALAMQPSQEWMTLTMPGLAEIADMIPRARTIPHYTSANAPDDPTPDEPDTDGFST